MMRGPICRYPCLYEMDNDRWSPKQRASSVPRTTSYEAGKCQTAVVYPVEPLSLASMLAATRVMELEAPGGDSE